MTARAPRLGRTTNQQVRACEAGLPLAAPLALYLQSFTVAYTTETEPATACEKAVALGSVDLVNGTCDDYLLPSRLSERVRENDALNDCVDFPAPEPEELVGTRVLRVVVLKLMQELLEEDRVVGPEVVDLHSREAIRKDANGTGVVWHGCLRELAEL